MKAKTKTLETTQKVVEKQSAPKEKKSVAFAATELYKKFLKNSYN